MSKTPFINEGLWTHAQCPKCSEISEYEGDVRGEMVECQGCGYEADIE